MNKNLKTIIAALGVICGLLLVAFVVLAVKNSNLNKENEKLNAILEMSCDYSGNIAQCRQGINMLKGMELEDIKK